MNAAKIKTQQALCSGGWSFALYLFPSKTVMRTEELNCLALLSAPLVRAACKIKVNGLPAVTLSAGRS